MAGGNGIDEIFRKVMDELKGEKITEGNFTKIFEKYVTEGQIANINRALCPFCNEKLESRVWKSSPFGNDVFSPKIEEYACQKCDFKLTYIELNHYLKYPLTYSESFDVFHRYIEPDRFLSSLRQKSKTGERDKGKIIKTAIEEYLFNNYDIWKSHNSKESPSQPKDLKEQSS